MSITKKAETSASTFNTETEIYITPQGEVIVADLPLELQAALESLGQRLDMSSQTVGANRCVRPWTTI